MGIKRPVDTSFWTDGKVDDFSPEDKYFMLYLLTNPFSKQLGIYEISIKQAAFQMGYSVDAFNVLLDRFENKYNIIKFSAETNEVAILNFLRHSVMKGGKPVEDCIRKETSLVKNKKLIDFVFARLHGREGLNETVKKIVDEYINNKLNNNNNNDNENERTVDVSLTNRQRIVTESLNCLDYADLFNYLCPSFPKVEVLSETMEKDLAESIKRYTDEQIKAAFKKSEKSCFLKGENDRKWKASFDWIIKPDNIAKVLNGNFDNKKSDDDLYATFEACVIQSWEENEPPKTAADDENIKARAEALKQQFAGKE